MAAPLDAPQTTIFSALTNLEQQIAYCMAVLLEKQNAYNVANPTTPKNTLAVSPSYSTNVAVFQANFPIEGDSVLQPLHENVTAAIPAA